MNSCEKIEGYLKHVKEIYEKGSDIQKASVISLLETFLDEEHILEHVNSVAKHDKITDLPDRESMMRDISKLRDEAMLVILHINQIEAIKQLYGFGMVQQMILNKAQTLQQIIKPSEAALYSINLQKFAILVREKKLFEKYLSILKFSIFNNIENFTYTSDDGKKIIFDFTAGISYGTEHLHHSANVALQEAIAAKESYRIYDVSPENIMLKETCMDKYQVYKEALHNGYVVPYFQPIINTLDGSVMKYEALARLQLPDGTIVAPYDFLHAAVEDRTFEFFTRQMMQKVFNVYDKTYVEISMNLTYENIRSATMLDYIKNRLEKYGGERITFEIVETEEIQDYEVVENFISMIKEYGCKISIDDFGSGYSNFTNLIKLNIDFIKIDGTLISRILTDEKARLMVHGLINFAKNINIKTIAEFVSSRDIAECLKELGVDYLQGYYYGEPKEAKLYGLA